MPDLSLLDLVDIAIVSAFFYSLLVLIRRTRTGLVLIGILLVGAIYLAARLLQLELTRAILQAFFAVFLVALIIIFQEEIKQFFERLARRSLLGGRRLGRGAPADSGELEQLVTALDSLAQERIGALVVVAGRALLGRHLQGGHRLDGQISIPLLKSLFDPHSAGHDGAVIVEAGRVTRFACRLPLSSNQAVLGDLGTRHAAALGLSEISDALCLVVSEERGVIGLARRGELVQPVAPGRLLEMLVAHRQETQPEGRARWRSVLLAHWPEKLLAVTLSAVLWFVFVHESAPEMRSVVVPVQVQVLPGEFQVVSLSPKKVTVSLSGPRRAFYFFSPDDVQLMLPLTDARAGTVVRPVLPSDLSLPGDLSLVDTRPQRVRIVLAKKKKPQT